MYWIKIKEKNYDLDKMEAIFITEERIGMFCKQTIFQLDNKKYFKESDLTEEEFKLAAREIEGYLQISRFGGKRGIK